MSTYVSALLVLGGLKRVRALDCVVGVSPASAAEDGTQQHTLWMQSASLANTRQWRGSEEGENYLEGGGGGGEKVRLYTQQQR